MKSLIFALLFSTALLAQTPAHPEMLVSTSWLADHLKDPNVVILHVAEKPSDFSDGHIPGAHQFLFTDFMDVDVPMRYEVPSTDKLKSVIEGLGISNNTRVVIYTSDWFPWASRAWFTFHYLGLDNAALLDGGYKQWTNEHRATTKDAPAPVAAKGSITPHPHPEYIAKFDEIRQLSTAGGNDQHSFLVDSRSGKRYSDGHLSGASNIFWEQTVQSTSSPVILPADKLRELWAAQGFKSGEKSVSYCEVGIQASHDYFIAHYLGYDAAMYDGSFHEWSMMKGLPTVKGTAKTGPLTNSMEQKD